MWNSGEAMGRTQRFERVERFRLTPAQLWSLLANTDRLNRIVGLPRMHYRAAPMASGGSRVTGEYRLGPVAFARWTEYPMEWRVPTFYAVERVYRWPPIRRFWGGIEITPVEAGGAAQSDLRVFAEIEPWTPLGDALVRFAIGPQGIDRAVREARRYESAVLSGAASNEQQDGEYPRLRALIDQLIGRGVDAGLARRIGQHLAHAEEAALVKMRPFELADAWGVERRPTLAAFLHAASIGLLTMTWDVLCPNCRIPRASPSALNELAPEAHCDVCNVRFEAKFDQLIEVRFTVARAIRRASHQLYCVGGPMNTPHVVGQLRLPPGGTGRLPIAQIGRHRLRSQLGGSPGIVDGAEGAAAAVVVTIDGAGVDPVAAAVEPGGEIEVVNRGAVEAKVVLEIPVWPDTVATAALVSTMQEFRDLFGSEALAPGLTLAIEALSFLFTDLTGSTGLYQRVGQARAFRLVQEHFGLLGQVIREHDGAQIKTIGDAVMAVFHSPRDAVAAALAMQDRIRRLDTDGAVDAGRLLKIGVHAGPALAVTLNERLDYFGTTVNIAARVEHEAAGGQIALSGAVAADPQTQPLLREAQAAGRTIQRATASLRGVAEPVEIILIDSA